MLKAKVEIWIWFGFVWAVIVARYTSRRLLSRQLHLQGDDYLMLVVAAFFTATIVMSFVLSRQFVVLENTFANQPNYAAVMAKFSILAIARDHLALTTTWLCKGCMLLMFHRMTLNLKQNTAIKVVSGVVVASWIFIEVAFVGIWCRPIGDYLVSQPANKECAIPTKHWITTAVLNISTDLMILGITIPMFITSRLPMKKKITVVGLFSLGIATIIITVLNRVGNIMIQSGFNYIAWDVRECSLAIIITNLPLTVPLWQRTKLLTSVLTGSRSNAGSSKGQSGASASAASGQPHYINELASFNSGRKHSGKDDSDASLSWIDDEEALDQKAPVNFATIAPAARVSNPPSAARKWPLNGT